MVAPDGGEGEGTPTLVEVNTRWHLTDFAPLTDACVGYNAVEETLAAYLDPERFAALPRVPPTGKGSRYGRVVHLVSYVEGQLEEVLHEEVRCVGMRPDGWLGCDVGVRTAPSLMSHEAHVLNTTWVCMHCSSSL